MYKLDITLTCQSRCLPRILVLAMIIALLSPQLALLKVAVLTEACGLHDKASILVCGQLVLQGYVVSQACTEGQTWLAGVEAETKIHPRVSCKSKAPIKTLSQGTTAT